MSSETSVRGCAHCTKVPRVYVGYQGDNLGWALAPEVLWRVQLCGCDHFWLHLSFTASSGNSPKSTNSHCAACSAVQVCVNLCARACCLWVERRMHQQMYWPTLSCIHFVYEEWWAENQGADQQCSEYLKSILWLCCICIIPAVVFLKNKKEGDVNTIFVQIRKEFGDGALEKRGTVQCWRRTSNFSDWQF